MVGKKVLVLGLGRNGGGLGVARWAARAGAEVGITDLGTEDDLRESLGSLLDTPARLTLGRHDHADLEWADLVIRNPGVPADAAILEQARSLGRPITMELALFLTETQANVIGITGSKGKTTASYAAAHLLKGLRSRVELVGNMGISALDIEPLVTGSFAVAEISSFQAEGMYEHGVAPHIYVVTNLLEDHLDRYPDIQAYHEAKAAVLDHQGNDDWAIIPSADYERDLLTQRARGRVAYFETAGRPLPGGESGVAYSGGSFYARWDDTEIALGRVAEVPSQAEHYLSNLTAALTAALAAGATPAHLRDRLPTLEPLENRQELVGTVDGVHYVNDTTATMPAAAAVSIGSYDGEDLVLIAGGASKRLDPTPLVDAAARHARCIVLLDGPATKDIDQMVSERRPEAIDSTHLSMESALLTGRSISRPGGIVLLAPGASSFGMFRDEFDRGEQFRQTVRSWADGDHGPGVPLRGFEPRFPD